MGLLIKYKAKKDNMEKKKCNKCGKVKDVSEFYKRKTGKNGLFARCKLCINQCVKKRIEKNMELRNGQDFKPVIEKKCGKCGITKNIEEFHEDVTSKDGSHSLCKLCVKDSRNRNKERISLQNKVYCDLNKEKISEQKAEYYKKNRDKISIKRKKRYEANKEKAAERDKEYYRNNKEKVLKRTKAYREKNRCKVLKREKLYRENNKDKIKEQRRQHCESNKKHRKEYIAADAKYERYINKLTVDESPKLHSDGVSLKIKCRYCGKYFVPSTGDILKRVRALNGEISGDQYLYCSENCKQACPVYNQKKYPKGFKVASSREVNSLVRQMVFERDNWTCQICGRTIKEAQLHCHHMDPVSQNPMFQNDIDSCITLCKDCHKMVHKQHGCRYIDLRCKDHQTNKQIPEIKFSG